jgi:hypothetical protein
MKTIITTVLTAAVIVLAPGLAMADDKTQEEPGFFGRIWQGTKDVLGIPRTDTDGTEKSRKDKYKDDDDRDANKRRDSTEDLLGRIFKDDEKRILRDYYGTEGSKKQKPLPPGLKKKVERGGELPPGWQKKMARGEVLPEDVYRYGRRLPDDVWRRLPRQPDGTSIIEVDGKVARIIDATRTVIDVFDL